MNKEDILLLAQLFHAMEEAVVRLEQSYQQNDSLTVEKIKKEILDLQSKIKRIIG